MLVKWMQYNTTLITLTCVLCRDAGWYIFKPKMLIWVNFEGSCNGRSAGIIYGHLVYLMVMWYIFPRLGML
jgi:hypothetical protein